VRRSGGERKIAGTAGEIKVTDAKTTSYMKTFI
jgi:hypothetical protein